MSFKEQAAEIEKLKQHIRTQDVELKYLRSINDLNSAWKSACDQKDETIKYQQQELEKSVNAAEQLRVENKKLHTDLHMQELEIKCLLKNDASDFGWKIVADESNEVIKDQKQDIENMQCAIDATIDAAKELRASHQFLQEDYKSLRRSHSRLLEEWIEMKQAKTRYKRKIRDFLGLKSRDNFG
ncbi:hypothetical protein KCU89_g392, partial [Aureobasidium melanogenum]